MMLKKSMVLACTAILVAGCSGAEDSGDSAETPDTATAQDAVAETEPEVQLSELAMQGKRLYLRCQACHTVEANGPHLVGPNLHGLIGATAGAKEGYAFSSQLSNSGLVWDRETLDKWIEAPQQLVPGNKMAFAGLPKEEDRAALIQYLDEATR